MEKLSYDMIKYLFEMGVYNVEKVMKFVDDKTITEEEFHFITGYSYKGIKKMG